jgi:hypothetical protein
MFVGMTFKDWFSVFTIDRFEKEQLSQDRWHDTDFEAFVTNLMRNTDGVARTDLRF